MSGKGCDKHSDLEKIFDGCLSGKPWPLAIYWVYLYSVDMY